MNKLEEQNKRLENILYEIGFYLSELHNDFLNFEHNKICFGITEEEHKKYFLGE